MNGRKLAPVLATATIAALAAAGCSSGSSPNSGAAQGNTVDVYSSLPMHGSSSAQTIPVVNGIRLALSQAHDAAGDFTVKYIALDDSTAAGKWDPAKTAANARAAARDPKAVYYIGDFTSGASAVSTPILSRADVAQVSPAGSDAGLTAGLPGSAAGQHRGDHPARTPNSLRVVPAGSIQAASDLMAMKQAGCSKVAVANDRGAYGAGLATFLEHEKGAYGVTIVSNTGIDPAAANFRGYASTIAAEGANCFFFAGTASKGAVRVTKDVNAALPDARVFGGDGVCTSSFTRAAQGGVPASIDKLIECTAVSRSLSDYPGGKAFLAGYKAVYHVSRPDPYAVYGYAAMELGLRTIASLGGNGDNKADVLKMLLAIKSTDSLLGAFGFNKDGGATLRSYGVYRVSSSGEPVYFETLTPANANG